jgi:hypothetical protein
MISVTTTRRMAGVAIALLLVGGCSAVTPAIRTLDEPIVGQVAPTPVEDSEPSEPEVPELLDGYAGATLYPMTRDAVVLSEGAEDWCATLEGRAGSWLAADTFSLVDTRTGEVVVLGDAARQVIEDYVSGEVVVTPEDMEQIDTLLRLPVPSALACRTAFEDSGR